MTNIQDRLSTGKGKFTPMYPELGTDPVSYDDCISEAFFDAERTAVFERTWLSVGRVERLPRPRLPVPYPPYSPTRTRRLRRLPPR